METKEEKLNILIKIGQNRLDKRQIFAVSLETEDRIENFKTLLGGRNKSKAIIYAVRNGRVVNVPNPEIDLVITENACYWNII